MSFGLADITAFPRFHTRDTERMPRGGGASSVRGGRARFLFLEQALLFLLLGWILWRRWLWFWKLLRVSFLVPLTRKSLSLAHHCRVRKERERERDDLFQYAAAIESVKRKKDRSRAGQREALIITRGNNVVLFRTGWALFGLIINRSKCFLHIKEENL